MRKLLFLILLSKSVVSLAQKGTKKDEKEDVIITFIGQLGYATTKELTSDETRGEVCYKCFVEKYEIKLWHNGSPLPVKVAPKEVYYNDEKNVAVEIRIEIEKSKIADPKSEEINGIILKKSTGKKFKISPFDIHTIPKETVNIINKTTIKLTKFIVLSEPEEVTITLIIDYINDRLGDASDKYDNFPRTIRDLNRLANESSIKYPIDYEKLMDYYKLLHFIEPFVLHNSFLNEEARKLNLRIESLSTAIKNKKDSREIRDDYDSALEVYKEYQTFYAKLNGYYMQLQSILFLRTPGQMVNGKITDGNSNPEKDAGKIRRVRLAIGVGASYRPDDNYNVSESAKSTVLFDSISRVNTVLSAGLIWSPFSVKSRPGKFSVGLFADYYISSSIGKITAKLPLGGGGGLGFSGRNFGVLAKVNLNIVRHPIKSFIENYKGQNQVLDKSLAPLDINNNLLFANKTNISYGISVFYFL